MAAYALNEEKMFSDIADGIAIIINSETGIYYGMNGFGTMVFENILKSIPVETIVARLGAAPNAPADMDARIKAFVKALLDFGIVVEAPARDEEPVLDVMVAQGENFDLSVEEFSDAQELLLADPIHEIKPETGWEPDKEALETDKEAIKERENKAR